MLYFSSVIRATPQEWATVELKHKDQWLCLQFRDGSSWDGYFEKCEGSIWFQDLQFEEAIGDFQTKLDQC